MSKSKKQALMSLLTMAMLIVPLAACEKRDVAADEKGPAEKAGQQIDQATVRLGEEMNKAAEKAGKGLQVLGQKLQEEAQEAQKKE